MKTNKEIAEKIINENLFSEFSGPDLIDSITAALGAKDKRIAKLEDVLQSCKAAMHYAFEDRNDRYYLNVKDKISEALKEGE